MHTTAEVSEMKLWKYSTPAYIYIMLMRTKPPAGTTANPPYL
jgi:hypothetical protein